MSLTGFEPQTMSFRILNNIKYNDFHLSELKDLTFVFLLLINQSCRLQITKSLVCLLYR